MSEVIEAIHALEAKLEEANEISRHLSETFEKLCNILEKAICDKGLVTAT